VLAQALAMEATLYVESEGDAAKVPPAHSVLRGRAKGREARLGKTVGE
jgi:hypothetical protein